MLAAPPVVVLVQDDLYPLDVVRIQIVDAVFVSFDYHAQVGRVPGKYPDQVSDSRRFDGGAALHAASVIEQAGGGEGGGQGGGRDRPGWTSPGAGRR